MDPGFLFWQTSRCHLRTVGVMKPSRGELKLTTEPHGRNSRWRRKMPDKGLMKKHWFVLLIAVIMVFALITTAAAHGDKRPVKKGILLVAFGTSVPEAQVAFENIDKKVKAAFPGVEVRWAYTSKIIRNKLAKEGKNLDSPAVALAKMADDDFTHVAVQSLHTIPGEEYHYLVQTAHAFQGKPKGLQKVLLGYPLLATADDLEKAAKAIMAVIPKDRKKDEAVILMGHGTHHPANAYYPAMQYYFWQHDPLVFVGTVEGSPSLDDVQAELKKHGVKKAYLMPFMSVAGDHAMNDMAGDEEDSWKSVLTKAGIECVPILKGTAEYDGIVDLWVDHLKGAMSHFK
jgi:sirohydrochlorin cobaltochelatase